MFCGSCGAKNEDNAEFCCSCGAKLVVKSAPAGNGQNPGETASQAAANVAAAAKSVNPKYILFGAIAAVVILVIAVVGNNMSHTVNLNNYLTVEFSGYENYGTATYNFDMNGFKEKYAGKMKVKGRTNTSMYDGVDAVSYYIYGSLDKSSELKNGDKVTFTWSVDSAINNLTNYKFKYKDDTFKVSGLEEVEAFDPFSYITVSFSGVSNNGNLVIENAEGTDGLVNYSYFSGDNYYGLKEGDVVTVTFYSSVDQCISEFGKVPSSLTKEYTVEGLKEYVASADKLTEAAMSEMIGQANDILTAQSANWDSRFTLVNTEYIGSYLLSPKFDNDANNVICVMKVNAAYTNSEGTVFNTEYYYPVRYYSVLTDKEGNIESDISNYNTCYSSFNREYEEPDNWFGTQSLYISGYESMDNLVKNEISSYLTNYKYDTNIDESKLIGEDTL